MKNDDPLKLLECYRQIIDGTSVNIKIDACQVIKIVTDDLISKYEHVLRTDNEERKRSFKSVLLYYLTEEEFKEVEVNLKKGRKNV